MCDLQTLVRMAVALTGTELRRFSFEQFFYLHQFLVLFINSLTSIDDIDYNLTLAFPSAFVPTLLVMTFL